MGRYLMEILTQIAVVCGSLSVIGVFFKGLSRTKWFRRLWRQNVSDPFTTWLSVAISEGGRSAATSLHQEMVEPILKDIRDDISEIRKELTVNGGTSVKDAVTEVRRQVEEFLHGQQGAS
jgi:hypothetical protein